jgi:hypothetical protein
MVIEYSVDNWDGGVEDERFDLFPLLKECLPVGGKPLSPRENMLTTLQQLWGQNESIEKEWLIKLWKILFKDVKLVNWLPSKRENEFTVELSNEFIGVLPNIIGCKVVLKQNIIVHFIEERIEGTGQTQKVIAFPQGGLVGRIGFGWFSKDIPIEKIVISRRPHEEIPFFKIVHSLGTKTKEGLRALEIWEGVRWESR